MGLLAWVGSVAGTGGWPSRIWGATECQGCACVRVCMCAYVPTTCNIPWGNSNSNSNSTGSVGARTVPYLYLPT